MAQAGMSMADWSRAMGRSLDGTYAYLLTQENTPGYTQEELNALNKELLTRWLDHDWPGAESFVDAAKWFADEMSRR
jgi:hypothetical protein